MVIKYNELIGLDKEQDADKLYDDWRKQYPDVEERLSQRQRERASGIDLGLI